MSGKLSASLASSAAVLIRDALVLSGLRAAPPRPGPLPVAEPGNAIDRAATRPDTKGLPTPSSVVVRCSMPLHRQARVIRNCCPATARKIALSGCGGKDVGEILAVSGWGLIDRRQTPPNHHVPRATVPRRKHQICGRTGRHARWLYVQRYGAPLPAGVWSGLPTPYPPQGTPLHLKPVEQVLPREQRGQGFSPIPRLRPGQPRAAGGTREATTTEGGAVGLDIPVACVRSGSFRQAKVADSRRRSLRLCGVSPDVRSVGVEHQPFDIRQPALRFGFRGLPASRTAVQR